MQTVARLLIALVSAVLVTALLTSIISSQFVLTELQKVGVIITLGDRLSMTLSDLGILKILGAVVAVCFLIGFIIAYLGEKYIGGSRTVWYMVAGFFALNSTLLIMSMALELIPVAGARTHFGLFFIGLAASIGGYVLASLSRKALNQTQYL